MLVKLSSTVTAAAVAITLGANPAVAALPQDHLNLIKAVAQAGVKVYLNPSQCQERKGLHGFYISQASILAVCQDNMVEVGEEAEVWTANDLDTIRHESHHLVQDCVGTRGDNQLDLLFGDGLEGYLRGSSLTEENARSIMLTYMQRGADTDTIELELEAFAVAADVTADNIAEGVRNMCIE